MTASVSLVLAPKRRRYGRGGAAGRSETLTDRLHASTTFTAGGPSADGRVSGSGRREGVMVLAGGGPTTRRKRVMATSISITGYATVCWAASPFTAASSGLLATEQGTSPVGDAALQGLPSAMQEIREAIEATGLSQGQVRREVTTRHATPKNATLDGVTAFGLDFSRVAD